MEWSQWSGLFCCFSVYETVALPLSYIGVLGSDLINALIGLRAQLEFQLLTAERMKNLNPPGFLRWRAGLRDADAFEPLRRPGQLFQVSPDGFVGRIVAQYFGIGRGIPDAAGVAVDVRPPIAVIGEPFLPPTGPTHQHF